jgi:hypothetical protein
MKNTKCSTILYFLVCHYQNLVKQSLSKLQFWMDKIVVFYAKMDSTPSNTHTTTGLCNISI